MITETSSPQDILKWAVATYEDKLAVVTSFQPTGIVTLHMLSEIAPRTPIITLDTHCLFAETYQLIDEVEALFNLNLKRVHPIEENDGQWVDDPDGCCNVRKVQPLERAMRGYDAWITGLRRDQSARRANTPISQWDTRHNGMKICPFATWTEDMIWTYIQAHELPYNALHDCGYASIGCSHCTAPATGREGRWQGRAKTECGIHLQ